ncbi:2-dehydropantoate 2-reductase [Shewanella sp. VB17]|uniref:ketopantoate reductase family protein n=1 Tax=Shewanella sp. VB17 TaxID=2739432 RepID=UPI00156759B9|nr:2-dehydropantoate 2-reductase [Shewanella sp. VB17]NRD75106.1 2-dehydropantoate 2-reductase [Shewanella sp. VB17]
MPINANNIAILGAGAIGQLIYHQLEAADAKAIFITKGVSGTHQQNLTFTNLAKKVSCSLATVIGFTQQEYHPKNLQHQLQNIELVIVCVKAYQVNDAVSSVIKYLPKHCHILLLHNGMGPHLQVQKKLLTQGLSVGTTSQGALKLAPWHVQQTGTGDSHLGPASGIPLVKNLKLLLLNAIPQSLWCDTILTYLWQKLAINAAINPLTTIDKCRNGALADPSYTLLINKIITELVNVAQADGVVLDKLVITNKVYEVITHTASNYSSMHQDVTHKRQTEIDYINGYIISRAKKHHLSCQINEQLLHQIKTIESQYLTIGLSDNPTY